jgi:hypothetical protein
MADENIKTGFGTSETTPREAVKDTETVKEKPSEVSK